MQSFFEQVRPRVLAVLSLTALLLAAACGPGTDGPSTPTMLTVAPGNRPLAQSPNSGPEGEIFKVCKVYVGGGPMPAVDIQVSVSTGDAFTVQLADGECLDIWDDDDSDGVMDDVTVTEVVPANYFASQQTFYSDGTNTPVTPGNETTDFTRIDHGVQVVFTNTYDPPPPPTGNEGCTPGYYKNLKKHSFAWLAAGWLPNQAVVAMFASAAPDPYAPLGFATLHDGLKFRGGSDVVGKAGIMLRAAIAAVLNADNPNVDYAFTRSEIQTAVNQALEVGDPQVMVQIGAELDAENNGVGGCPLGNAP